jgi:hypothetical protein
MIQEPGSPKPKTAEDNDNETQARRREAIARIKELSKGQLLGGSLKELINVGRKGLSERDRG